MSPLYRRWPVGRLSSLAEEVTGRDSLRGTLDDIQAIGDAARRASSLVADIPGAAREASVPVRELLDQQRTEVLAAIPGAAREASVPVRELLDQQRTEILAAVDRERLTISEFITAEREAALAVVSEERRAALASISQERAVVLAALDAMAKRSIEDASGRARGLADYVFGRALILIAASALLFAAGYRLARSPAPRRQDQVGTLEDKFDSAINRSNRTDERNVCYALLQTSALHLLPPLISSTAFAFSARKSKIRW